MNENAIPPSGFGQFRGPASQLQYRVSRVSALYGRSHTQVEQNLGSSVA